MLRRMALPTWLAVATLIAAGALLVCGFGGGMGGGGMGGGGMGGGGMGGGGMGGMGGMPGGGGMGPGGGQQDGGMGRMPPGAGGRGQQPPGGGGGGMGGMKPPPRRGSSPRDDAGEEEEMQRPDISAMRQQGQQQEGRQERVKPSQPITPEEVRANGHLARYVIANLVTFTTFDEANNRLIDMRNGHINFLQVKRENNQQRVRRGLQPDIDAHPEVYAMSIPQILASGWIPDAAPTPAAAALKEAGGGDERRDESVLPPQEGVGATTGAAAHESRRDEL